MESTVASKLEALLKLQQIDSQLDEIRRVRGDLPEEVRDLEDEIAGYEVRVNKYDEEIEGLNQTIAARKQAIKDSETLIRKYEDQQTNVRNNREYDAITKEIELQRLEMQISEKNKRSALPDRPKTPGDCRHQAKTGRTPQRPEFENRRVKRNYFGKPRRRAQTARRPRKSRPEYRRPLT